MSPFFIAMEREEILRRAKAMGDPAKNSEELYTLLDAAGISYQKTNCYRCRRDLYAILMEELGEIQDASELSEFNQKPTKLIYVHPRTVLWNGHKINDKTPEDIKRAFHATHRGFFMEQTTIPLNETN